MLGSDLTRTQVCSVTVLDSLEACPEDAWDVSENGDGSVMAWTEESGDLFDLYLAGEGGVAAPADCSELLPAMKCGACDSTAPFTQRIPPI